MPTTFINHTRILLNPEATPFYPCSPILIPNKALPGKEMIGADEIVSECNNIRLFNHIDINTDISIVIENYEKNSVDIEVEGVYNTKINQHNISVTHPCPIMNPLSVAFLPWSAQGPYDDIENPSDVYTKLNDIRVKNIHRVIISHLNINSIRNKFVALSDIAKNKIDIMLISETKLNSSFSNSLFYIDGFSPPYRNDRTDRVEA